MAKIWYGHFDSTETDPRKLLAEDWAGYIRTFITDGIRNGGTCLQVSSAEQGMTTRIDEGICSIQGYIFKAEEDENGRYITMLHDAAHPTLPRIDRLVLRLDRQIKSRSIIPVVKYGLPAVNPEAPELTRNANIWELSLARVRIDAGISVITPEAVTDERFDNESCGLMHSVLGLDSSAWQAQFDGFLSGIEATDEAFLEQQREIFEGELAGRSVAFDATFDSAFGAVQTWFDGAQTELARAQFDIGNLAALPGNTSYISFIPGGVLQTVMDSVSGKVVAELDTRFTSGGAEEIETVYLADGETVQRKTRVVTEFLNAGVKQAVTTVQEGEIL